MSEIAVAVVWCVLQVTIVSTLALASCAVARRFAPAAGSLIPLAGLLLVLGLSIFAFCPWPSWFELVADNSDHAPRSELEEANALSPDPGAVEQEALQSSVTSPEAPAALAQLWQAFSQELTRPTSANATEAPRFRWPVGLTMLLVAGAIFGTLHLAAGLLAVRSYRRRSHPVVDHELSELIDVLRAELSLRSPVEIRQCDDLTTAATVGCLHPLVLLPPEWQTWTAHERRAVLAHELAHIARHDFLGAIIAQISLSLHFYHPLVHWLSARLRLEQELAADASAAALVGGPKIYLRTLADLALRQPERRMGWPARTFLPSRGTFLRRIEMLRDARNLPANQSPVFRWSLVGLLVMAGLLATGLRGPSGGSASLVAAQPAAIAAQKQVKPEEAAALDTSGIDASYIPEDAVAVAAIRPAGLMRRGDLKDVRERLDEFLTPELSLSPAEVEQITFAVHSNLGPKGDRVTVLPMSCIIIRTLKPNDFLKSLEKLMPGAVETKLGGAPGQSYFRSPDPQNGLCFYRPDGRTLVVDLEEPIVRSIVGKPKKSPLISGEAWKKAAEGQLALAIDGAWLRSMIAPTDPSARPPMFGGEVEAFSPLWLETETLTLSARLEDSLTLRVAAVCTTADGAKKVQDTAQAARTLARNLTGPLRKQLAGAPPAERPILDSLLELGEKLLDDIKFEREGKVVEAVTATEIDPLKMSLLTMMVMRARVAAMQASNANNLKQIGVAMHNYNATYNYFPAAAILGPDGKTVHSWRVAILPYIEQDALYRAYKFDEPWDSENNKKILAKMPAVFRHPSAPKDSTSAAYYVLTGERVVFSSKPSPKGVKISEISDGTSNTFMIVEAKRDIPWTKPDDIPYAADKPLPKLGGFAEGGFYAAMCDGSVHLIGSGTAEALLRAWITRDAGEPINFEPGPVPDRLPTRKIGLDKVDVPERNPLKIELEKEDAPERKRSPTKKD